MLLGFEADTPGMIQEHPFNETFGQRSGLKGSDEHTIVFLEWFCTAERRSRKVGYIFFMFFEFNVFTYENETIIECLLFDGFLGRRKK